MTASRSASRRAAPRFGADAARLVTIAPRPSAGRRRRTTTGTGMVMSGERPASDGIPGSRPGADRRTTERGAESTQLDAARRPSCVRGVSTGEWSEALDPGGAAEVLVEAGELVEVGVGGPRRDGRGELDRVVGAEAVDGDAS